VTDGYTERGFSFFGVYSPVMSRPVIEYAAACCDFGSDDTEPKHILLFEVEGAIYYGPYGLVQRALRKTNEHLITTKRDLNEILESLNHAGTDSFRWIGGFESLLGPTPENEALGAQVVRELDAQITRKTIEELAACDSPGMEAMTALVYAHDNAARLGLDPDSVRRARETYMDKLGTELNDQFVNRRNTQN
jgi:hypothetical protein